MECDDTKGSRCAFGNRRPGFPMSQVHLVMWEKVSTVSDVSLSNSTVLNPPLVPNNTVCDLEVPMKKAKLSTGYIPKRGALEASVARKKNNILFGRSDILFGGSTQIVPASNPKSGPNEASKNPSEEPGKRISAATSNTALANGMGASGSTLVQHDKTKAVIAGICKTTETEEPTSSVGDNLKPAMISSEGKLSMSSSLSDRVLKYLPESFTLPFELGARKSSLNGTKTPEVSKNTFAGYVPKGNKSVESKSEENTPSSSPQQSPVKIKSAKSKSSPGKKNVKFHVGSSAGDTDKKSCSATKSADENLCSTTTSFAPSKVTDECLSEMPLSSLHCSNRLKCLAKLVSAQPRSTPVVATISPLSAISSIDLPVSKASNSQPTSVQPGPIIKTVVINQPAKNVKSSEASPGIQFATTTDDLPVRKVSDIKPTSACGSSNTTQSANSGSVIKTVVIGQPEKSVESSEASASIKSTPSTGDMPGSKVSSVLATSASNSFNVSHSANFAAVVSNPPVNRTGSVISSATSSSIKSAISAGDSPVSKASIVPPTSPACSSTDVAQSVNSTAAINTVIVNPPVKMTSIVRSSKSSSKINSSAPSGEMPVSKASSLLPTAACDPSNMAHSVNGATEIKKIIVHPPVKRTKNTKSCSASSRARSAISTTDLHGRMSRVDVQPAPVCGSSKVVQSAKSAAVVKTVVVNPPAKRTTKTIETSKSSSTVQPASSSTVAQVAGSSSVGQVMNGSFRIHSVSGLSSSSSSSTSSQVKPVSGSSNVRPANGTIFIKMSDNTSVIKTGNGFKALNGSTTSQATKSSSIIKLVNALPVSQLSNDKSLISKARKVAVAQQSPEPSPTLQRNGSAHNKPVNGSSPARTVGGVSSSPQMVRSSHIEQICSGSSHHKAINGLSPTKSDVCVSSSLQKTTKSHIDQNCNGSSTLYAPKNASAIEPTKALSNVQLLTNNECASVVDDSTSNGQHIDLSDPFDGCLDQCVPDHANSPDLLDLDWLTSSSVAKCPSPANLCGSFELPEAVPFSGGATGDDILPIGFDKLTSAQDIFGSPSPFSSPPSSTNHHPPVSFIMGSPVASSSPIGCRR